MAQDTCSCKSLFDEDAVSCVGMETQNIIKSPNDKKNYRVIKLSNGLVAMLISDPPADGSPVPAAEEEDSDTDSQASGGQESEPESEDEMEIDHEGAATSAQPSAKQSAAALCVRIGSFSDPDDLPGFAHFLEHMVFMGSEKYPKEDELEDYLNRHGGESNAWTDHERTLFYFSIQQKKFRKALDRFANFFISPLLKKDAVDREMQAVDSEFQLCLQSDSDRLNEILRTTAVPGHPMGRFMIGNLKSLKHDPESQGIDVYGRLRAFLNRNYSAHYMTLAVQSMDSLDVMEKWVRDIFSDIPNNGLPVPGFDQSGPPFNTPGFPKLYKVIPFEDVHKLQIVWALPSLVREYRQKPIEYFTALVQHEGPGTILSYLKKKLWAVGLSGGGTSSCGSYDNNSTWTAYYVDVTLSDEGLKHAMEVATVVFEYMDLLRKVGPVQRIFEETKKIEEAKFRWKEPGDPLDYVMEVAEAMQNYPPVHYLTGKTQLYDFNAEMIECCLRFMTPERANITLMSKSFEKDGLCNLTEPWFETRYCVEDVDESWTEIWSDLQSNPELDFPSRNPFIVTNFDLKEREEGPIAEKPRMVINWERCKVWFKQGKFEVPKGIIYISLRSQQIPKSLENTTLCDLFINILLQTLAESAYPACQAGYEYSVEGLEDMVLLQMDGFSEKLPTLLDMIIDHIVKFVVKPDQFAMVKEQLEKAYYNEMIKPYELGSMVRLSILDPAFKRQSDRYLAVRDLTPDQLTAFLQEFLADLTVEGLVFGNFTAKNVEDIGRSLHKKLDIQKSHCRLPQNRLQEIPKGKYTCRVKSVKRDDPNSCVTNYYQIGPGTIHTSCVNQLFNILMREACFDNLRTKHQLSYTVFSETLETRGILGLHITVEPQAHKFSIDHVEDLMTKFLEGFKENLFKMSDAEFTAVVQSMITHRQTVDTHIGEEASRIWPEIQKNFYVFDRRQREIEELRKITKEEVILWYRQFVGPDCRKISLQVEGCSNPKEASETSLVRVKAAEGSPPPLHHLEFVQPFPPNPNYITCIPDFCQSLQCYPFSQITS